MKISDINRMPLSEIESVLNYRGGYFYTTTDEIKIRDEIPLLKGGWGINFENTLWNDGLAISLVPSNLTQELKLNEARLIWMRNSGYRKITATKIIEANVFLTIVRVFGYRVEHSLNHLRKLKGTEFFDLVLNDLETVGYLPRKIYEILV